MLTNLFFAFLPFLFGAALDGLGVAALESSINPDDTAAIATGVVLFTMGWLLTFALLRRYRQ